MTQIIQNNGWWWGGWWGGWEWDMKKSVYDPNNVWKNVYDYTYFINKPTIPTKTSDLNNDSGFIDSSDLSTALSSKQDTLTAGTGIDITSNVISATGGGWSWDVVWPSSSTNWHLAVFDGTTGKLIKDWWAMPTIPTKVSQLDNDSWFTTNTGTITSVKMNGTTVASSWEADLWTVITSHQSIKTVNSNSLVWSGNVSINETKVSSTAPTSPTEWMVWYDTTNDVLKTYDGSNWNEVWWGWWGWEWNTKTFYLSSTSDTTTAQAALDWYLAGKNPIVVLTGRAYIVEWYLSTQLTMMSFNFWVTNYKPSYATQSYSQTVIYRLEINISSGSVTYISASNTSSIGGTYLSPWVDYPTPYLPEYEWSPATKKYVDDNVAVFYSPSNDTSDLNSDVWPYMATWLTSTGQLPLDKTTYKDCVIVIWNNIYSRRLVCDITATEDDHSSIRIQFCNIRSVTTSNYTSWTNVWTSRTNVPVIYMNFTYYSGVWTYVNSENSRQFWTSPYVLATNYNYSTPYTPQYPWSPTTKKYVDDKLTTNATAPSSPTEWMLWYDSTNHQLKYYDGSNWKTVTAS